jgi:carbonic anhydrase
MAAITKRFTAAVAAMILTAFTLSAHALSDAGTQTAASQKALSPDQALALLKEGNARFVAGNMQQRDWSAQVAATASGQYPHSVILGCVDSRVPPEVVFDQGIGDIFSARVAGNTINTDLLGSMEFAAAVAGSRAIVVLGHTSCGAVKGACDGVELGNLTQTLSNISPAVYAVRDIPGERSSKNAAFVDAVAHENVRMTVDNILERSNTLSDLVAQGKLKVVGAMYDISTGKVTFLD